MARIARGTQPRSSWAPRILMAALGVPLLCGGCGLAGFLYIRSDSPYEQAVERVRNHRQVTAALGSPVSSDFMFKGNMKSQGDNGVAVIEIGLSGPRQDAVLYVNGVKTSGLWGFNRLRVVAHDGTVINVVGE